jgi:hypothetical protein
VTGVQTCALPISEDIRIKAGSENINFMGEDANYPKLTYSLLKLLNLEKNWDSYDGDPPNLTAVNNAKRFINNMPYQLSLLEISISPSCIGGIGIIFYKDGKDISLEFTNKGEQNFINDEMFCMVGLPKNIYNIILDYLQ